MLAEFGWHDSRGAAMTNTGWVLKLGDRPAEERSFEGVDGLGAGTDDRILQGAISSEDRRMWKTNVGTKGQKGRNRRCPMESRERRRRWKVEWKVGDETQRERCLRLQSQTN